MPTADCQIPHHARRLLRYLFDVLLDPRAVGFALRAFLAKLAAISGHSDLIPNLVSQYEGIGLEGLGLAWNGAARDDARGMASGGVRTCSSSSSSSSSSNTGNARVLRHWSRGSSAISGRGQPFYRPRPAAFAAGSQPAFQCALDQRGTPTCRSCLARIDFEVKLVWEEHLLHLPADVRRVVLPEWVEELTSQALGASEVLHFWRQCFGPSSPRFFMTKKGTAEHRLWQEADYERGGG